MSEQGIVKWYSLAKGYGFLRRDAVDEDADDIFVHHSEVAGAPLIEGERVSFEIVDGPKGLKASNIRRIADEVTPELTAQRE